MLIDIYIPSQNFQAKQDSRQDPEGVGLSSGQTEHKGHRDLFRHVIVKEIQDLIHGTDPGPDLTPTIDIRQQYSQ